MNEFNPKKGNPSSLQNRDPQIFRVKLTHQLQSKLYVFKTLTKNFSIQSLLIWRKYYE